MRLTAQIHLLPSANAKVLNNVFKHAQGLKETDPQQSIDLYEQVIRLLCTQIENRNKKIRIFQRILLDKLPKGDDA